MNRIIFLLSLIAMLNMLASCNRKTNPEAAAKPSASAPVAVKHAKRAIIKTAVPRVITVSEGAARRSVDGRYYYDLEGHRYWRNNRDGKFYLFHKSMFDNPDFRAPGG